MHKSLKVLLCVCATLAFMTACGTGESVVVDSCDECIGSDKCVQEGGTLYCSDPCLSDLSCKLDHSCVPELEEPDDLRIVWVCLPDEYFVGRSTVWAWGNTDCVEGGGDECPTNMTCLVDVSENPDIFFCSEECNTGSDCITGCCYHWSRYTSYCAPMFPYCRTDIGEVWYWGTDDCTQPGDECPGSMTCLFDDSQTPYLYFCSDTCIDDGDCVTGCCSDGYCAPERPYCS